MLGTGGARERERQIVLLHCSSGQQQGEFQSSELLGSISGSLQLAPKKQQPFEGSSPTYHVCRNLFRCVAIQVKLESDHLVVMSFQLALHHLVASVAHLRREQTAVNASYASTLFVFFPSRDVFCRGKIFRRPTLSMLSLGLLIFSCRERVRVDRRWCLRTLPPWVPSQPSLISFPEVASELMLRREARASVKAFVEFGRLLQADKAPGRTCSGPLPQETTSD